MKYIPYKNLYFIKIFITSLFCLIAFPSCSKEKAPKSPETSEAQATQDTPSTPVSVAVALEETISQYYSTFSTPLPSETITIFSEVSGKLTKIHAPEGSYIQKGQILFSIDPTNYQINLEKSKALLVQASYQLKLSEDELTRSEELYKKQALAFSKLEDLRVKTLSAKTAASLAEIEVQLAQKNLDNCKIKAEISGRLGTVSLSKGNFITAFSTKLSSIEAISTLDLSFSIPESIFFQVKKELDSKSLSCFVFPSSSTTPLPSSISSQTSYIASINFYSNQIDPKTGSILIKASLPNKDHSIWPGQFVRIKILTNTWENAVTIPIIALKSTEKGPVVSVVKEDSTVEQRPVILGSTVDKKVIIKEGIEKNELIVTEGHHQLSPEAKVSFEDPRDEAKNTQNQSL